MKALNVKNLTFSYDKKSLNIKDISFDVEVGKYVSIIGHNGSGKSTLAKLIVGLLTLKSGEINVFDMALNKENINKIRRRVGIVFQNPDNQFVGATVEDDIAFGLENRCIDPNKMKDIILDFSSKVGMEQYLNKEPSNLSGGQKQRVAIAGVLALNPDLLILDEATSMLDPKGTREINEMIKKLKSLDNKTIISITHNLEEAVFADRVIVLNKGKIVLDGTPKDVLKEKDILEASGLKLIDGLDIISTLNDLNIKNKEELINALWELTFKM